MTFPNKGDYIEALWLQFVSKIEEEWPKYQNYGDQLSDLAYNGNQLNFARAVRYDIIKTFKKKGVETGIVGENTLHRHFQNSGISINVKDKTLEMLSCYLGYRSWSAFQHANYHKIRKPPTLMEEKAPRQKSYLLIRHWKKVALLIALSLTLISINLLPLDPMRKQKNADNTLLQQSETEITRFNFERLIKKAAEAEFRAYAALPALDTLSLGNYFTKDGMARKDIMGILLRAHARGSFLISPPSSYNVLNTNVKSVSADQIRIESTEKWYLLWCDPTDSRGWLYDVMNVQEYYLKKENSVWKIDVNHYGGRAIHPAVPPSCD